MTQSPLAGAERMPAPSKPMAPSPAKPQHISHPKYRSDIDGLRAIAVLTVVGFHAFPNWISGGYVGVDVFFVISGFLISSIIFGNLETGTFSYIDFYARRIRRIFPALVLVLTATFAFGWYVLLSDEFRQVGKHIAAGSGFVSNLMLWSEAGYFDETADTKPLLHLWSLGVEEQFYLIWPILLGLVWKYKHDFLRITLLIAAASFAVNIFTVTSHPVAAYYSPLSRFWELMIGGLLAYMALHRPGRLAGYENLRSASGLLLIGAGVLVLNKSSAFPGWWALLPTIGAALMISAGPDTWVNRNILGNRILVFFGLISYPLYLWHWPLLSYAQIIEGGTTSRETRIVMVVASIVLAWLTYALVEKKIRSTASNRFVVALSSLTAILLLCGTLVWTDAVKPRNAGKDLEFVVQAIEDWEFPPKDFDASIFDGQTIYSRLAGEGKVLFLGDSHIQQYAPRVGKLLKEGNENYKSAVFATTGGCPPIPFVHEDQHRECESWLVSTGKLAREGKFDTIVIGACWNCYFIDMAGKKDEDKAAMGGPASYEYYYLDNNNRKYFRTGEGTGPALTSLEHFLTELSGISQVYLVLDNPMGAQFHPKTFFEGTRLTRLTYKDSSKLHQLTDEQKNLRERMTTIARRAGARIIDPAEQLCRDDLCVTTLEDGRPLYKDSNHFRRYYSENHAVFIDTTLRINRESQSGTN